ncbi:MAG: sucrose-phosphate phosphatase [Prochlorothrix sp.]
MPPALFITDLDNTFVGDDTALALLQQQLQQWQQQHKTRVVYSTGRSRVLYQELQQEKGLMTPDALVTAVGTEIYLNQDTEPDRHWTQTLAQDWDRDTAHTLAQKIPSLQPQPATEQRPLKVSYFVTDPHTAPALIQQLDQDLAQAGVKAQLIYSDDRDLDILPAGANKGAAMAFLQERWGIQPPQTVACGDSGNDQALFADDRAMGIIVGNAKLELLSWHQTTPSTQRYLAQAHYAAGILEGLRHFGFLTP